MNLFSQEDILKIEQITLAELGLSKMQFIDTIGLEIADEIGAEHDSRTPVIIFAGPDDCGAYALAAATALSSRGFSVYSFLFNIGGNRLTPECDFFRNRFINATEEKSLSEVTGMRFSMPEIDSGMIVIDGLFGSNITGPLSRGYQVLVTNINESGAKVIAIDSPSGLPGNPMSGLINSKIIHADITLTPLVPKLSFFINENIELVGEWKVIGPRPSAATIRHLRSSHYLIEGHNIQRCLRPRPFDSSKKDFGSAIIFSGSYGMMGAAVLTTKAASRSGCGKVTCHTPSCGYNIMQISVPDALFESDPNEKIIENIEITRNYSAVAIGPGMGTADATIDALETFLKVASANNRPVILDADALNCIASVRRCSTICRCCPFSRLTPVSLTVSSVLSRHHQPVSPRRLKCPRPIRLSSSSKAFTLPQCAPMVKSTIIPRAPRRLQLPAQAMCLQVCSQVCSHKASNPNLLLFPLSTSTVWPVKLPNSSMVPTVSVPTMSPIISVAQSKP